MKRKNIAKQVAALEIPLESDLFMRTLMLGWSYSGLLNFGPSFDANLKITSN